MGEGRILLEFIAVNRPIRPIQDWPFDWFASLEQCVEVGGCNEAARAICELRRLGVRVTRWRQDSGRQQRGAIMAHDTTKISHVIEPIRRLVDAQEMGRLLGCSPRTALRLADAGRIPWGVKLGGLRRWDSQEIQEFIAAGCKPARSARR
jgi:predicted DNA-binding transcriptional regulator AlpA